ncbi:MAG TPA: hypothetical protein VJP78_14275 [Thermoleophilia bacterium]|nr:hypothetical protein [Thermoleophilia bacterium]
MGGLLILALVEEMQRAWVGQLQWLRINSVGLKFTEKTIVIHVQ